MQSLRSECDRGARRAGRHESIRLRRLVACVPLGLMLMGGAAVPARAADWLGDLPLRGSLNAGPMTWDGFYAGAAYGYGNPNVDFGNSAHDMIQYMLRNTALENEQHPEDWTALGSENGQWSSYGGFVGFNTRWDGGLILGGEVGYNYVSGDSVSASDAMARKVTLTTGTDTVTIYASSSMQLKDYATVRGRIAYDMGRFLPYAFIGVAVGRFNYMTNVTLIVTGTDQGNTSDSDGKDNAISAGVDTGLGADIALTSNLFVRGEWEYMAFAPLSGIRYTANVFRGGVGFKF